eukprot:c24249_g2_i3 orf=1133-2308(-)
MEVGQSVARHYAKTRWDAIGEREPFYAKESWRDKNFNSIGSSTHTWNDGVSTPTSSSSPSLSSVLPASVADGVVDKVLYHNLVEMIPLVETFMEQQQQQQNNKSFLRHASLMYTPSPRDALKASEHSSKGKKGSSQLLRGKRGGVKHCILWDNDDSMCDDKAGVYPDAIPTLVFATDNQTDLNSHSNAMVAQLQSQMEQLEQKLQEKDIQLQAAENSTQQADLLRLKASMEELQDQILLKEMEIQKAINQLSKTQHEVESLQSLLEKAELDVEASNLTVAKVNEESQSLQCQVAAFLLWMESISSCLDNDTEGDEPRSLSVIVEPTMESRQVDRKHVTQIDAKHVELTRRKYLASLIAARHNPSDELMLLVAELRGQLQAYLLHPDASRCI